MCPLLNKTAEFWPNNLYLALWAIYFPHSLHTWLGCKCRSKSGLSGITRIKEAFAEENQQASQYLSHISVILVEVYLETCICSNNMELYIIFLKNISCQWPCPQQEVDSKPLQHSLVITFDLIPLGNFFHSSIDFFQQYFKKKVPHWKFWWVSISSSRVFLKLGRMRLWLHRK